MTRTDPLDIVASTADAAFVTDEENRVVIWNPAAERLLGRPAAGVLGKPCHEVLCGRDMFGNRFCDENCPVVNMTRKGEGVRRFELDLRKSSGEVFTVSCSILVVPGSKSSRFFLIHLLQPSPRGREADELIHRILAAAPPGGTIPASQGAASPPPPLRTLTARELEVLRLMADGTSTEAIADSLFISKVTVRNHIQNILRKLGAHNKLQAVSRALQYRLI
ncbi:MAG: LuxR C-terminal-related transcriptional regulator [Acidobacteriota bacterium]